MLQAATRPVVASPQWVVPFAATVLAMLALQMSNLGFAPLLPAIQKDFHLSFSQIGFFTGMYGILGIIFSLPAGLLAKRLGEKRVLIGGMFFIAIGLLLVSQAPGFEAALVGRAVWIGGYRFSFVCVLTAVALTTPATLKGRGLGVVGAVSSLASMIGAPLASHFEQTIGWRQGIFIYAAIALAGAAVFGMFYKSPDPVLDEQPTAAHSTTHPAAPVSAFRMPLVWFLATLMGMVGVISFSVTFFVPSAAKSVYNINAGWVIGSGYFLAIFSNLLFGYLMDRYNRWIVMSVLMALLVPACFAMTIPHELAFRIATALVLALGFTATNQVYGIAAAVLSGRETGNVMGLISLGAGTFGYLGPQLLGTLRDATGNFNAGWYLMMTVAALCVAGLLYLKHYTTQSRPTI